MSAINFYEVLGIKKDCTPKEIREAYRDLAIKFHPDKPGGDEQFFLLITNAYNTLIDQSSRSNYDKSYAIISASEKDFDDLKNQAQNYYDKQKTQKEFTKDELVKAKKIFQNKVSEKDAKMGLTKDTNLSEGETKKRIRDFALMRRQDDIELLPKQMFQPGQFNINKFNEFFDKMKGGDDKLVPRTGNPSAFNSAENGEDFGSINITDDPFTEQADELEGDGFAPIDKSVMDQNKLNSIDINALTGSSYTDKHDIISKSDKKIMRDKLLERQNDTDMIGKMGMNDYDTKQEMGGYGIFHPLGLAPSTLMWDGIKDPDKEYKRLLEFRQKESSKIKKKSKKNKKTKKIKIKSKSKKINKKILDAVFDEAFKDDLDDENIEKIQL